MAQKFLDSLVSEQPTLKSLIDQGRQHEAHFASLQGRLPTIFTPDQVRYLQEWYLSWVSRAAILLPDPFKTLFMEAYEGKVPGTLNLPGISPRVFIAEPVATQVQLDFTNLSSAIAEAFRQKSTGTQTPSNLRYKHPVDTAFYPGFRYQIHLLTEASYGVVQPSTGDSAQTQFPLYYFHPTVREKVGTLYTAGHFRQAVSDAANLLIDYVRIAAKRPDLDGADVMPPAFNVNDKQKPILRVREHDNEQRGIYFLFAGLVAAVRNPASHPRLNRAEMEFTEAFEWLTFISALFRIVDQVAPADPFPFPEGARAPDG